MKKFAFYDSFLHEEKENGMNSQLTDLLFSVLSNKNKATTSRPENTAPEKTNKNEILSALNEAETDGASQHISDNFELKDGKGQKAVQSKTRDSFADDSEYKSHIPSQPNADSRKERAEQNKTGGNDYFAPPPCYML